MKSSNLKKRERNGKISFTITYIFMTLYTSSLVIPFSFHFTLAAFFVFFVVYLTIAFTILPSICSWLDNNIYTCLNKNIDMIENNLSSNFSSIYLNVDCLKKSAIPLHSQRKYMAKLNSDCSISIRIENEYDSNDFLEKQITDYSWFLSIFKFEE